MQTFCIISTMKMAKIIIEYPFIDPVYKVTFTTHSQFLAFG